MKRLIIQTVFIIISVVIACFTFRYVEVIDLKNVLSTLQNISAAVFTLAGIWIAYIYPEAITAFTNPEKVSLIKGTDKTKRIENLVLIILTSAFVIVSILLFNLSNMLFKNIPFILENKDLFKGISISFVLYLSLNQTKAVMSIMVSNIDFVNELHKNKTDQEANNEL